MKKLLSIKVIVSAIIIVGLLFIGVGIYFFNIAQIRGEQQIAQMSDLKVDSPVYEYRKAFFAEKKEIWEMESDDGLLLKAWYLPAPVATNKTIIVAHGHNASKERMAEYGWMFHQWGYNVLMPDNRAHGASEGKLIGYGWNDRLDYLKWIDLVIAENGEDCEISLYGLSMGGSLVMMLSGEELPSNIISFIQDCGYDSVWNQIAYRAKVEYSLPTFPIVDQVSLISKLIAGYSYKEASAVEQLKKNKHPFLFIHGDEDDYVPVDMVHNNYNASGGEKELLIVPGAGHADAIEVDLESYEATIKGFLDKHMPIQ